MAKSYRTNEQQGEEAQSSDGASQGSARPFPPGFNPRVQATKLYAAMKGMGTDERAIFDVLQSGRADLNRAIEMEFDRMYDDSLREWLRGDLSGSDLSKALTLLGRGDFTLAQKLTQAADGWGADEQKIFRALEIASPAELAEVKANAALKQRLHSELNDADYELAMAYLEGEGVLAAKLRRAVSGWGTDEAAIWRALETASEQERTFVLGKRALMDHLKSDLSESDFLRARRMLSGTWDNVDKIEVALKGWGTDEALLLSAIAGLTATEYAKLNRGTDEMPQGVSSLKSWLYSDLSGATEFEALQSLHQIQLAHDPGYGVRYREEQAAKLGEDAMRDEGAAALVAGAGQSLSPVSRLRAACIGMGVNEEKVWDVAAQIPSEQGRWIIRHNPDNVMGVLQADLSFDEFLRVRRALGGGAVGRIEVLKNAVAGWGTTEHQLYDALDSILAEGLQGEVLQDGIIMGRIKADIDDRMYAVFREALSTGQFTPMMRLTWATARYGTDEDLLFSVCGEHGAAWKDGDGIRSDVDEILLSELSTRDYWRAKDLIRGEPESEQERLERAKEMLERERSSDLSVYLVDLVSDSGQNADEAWRDYQVAYNQAYEDGKVSEEEQARLRDAEDYSKYTTEQVREAKATFAQWASQIAITIVGIAATILTAGAAAGPFIAALSANAGTIAATMVASAALKVGIHKAIEGEGYDLDSMDTLVDGVGAAIEGGLFIVGNIGAAKLMQGISKTQYAGSIGSTVEQAFGGAGKRILAGGLEGTIDGSIGGMGEGLFRGLVSDQTWSGDLGNAFSNISASTILHGSLGGGMGFAGGSLFKSIGETFGPAARKMLGGNKSLGEAAGSGGTVDDIMARMPDDLEASSLDQRRLVEAAFETNQRMQVISDDITSDFGLKRSLVGLKGNDFGLEDVTKVDKDEFIGKVLEKTRRWGDPEAVGQMRDMSRGRFDVDSFEEANALADSLERKLNEGFGSGNVERKALRDVYKRHHILVKDPQTGVWHEWQIGTKSLTKMIEEVRVILPEGVELHGNNFHVVMYDVLDKLNDPAIRAQHGLPDNIASEIGLEPIRKRYDKLMIEAGTVKKGAGQPDDFDERLLTMGRELGEALDRLESKYPGMATKLDTKLAAEKAASVQPGSAGPRTHPDMPARVDSGSVGSDAAAKDRPKLRPEHEGSVEYEEYRKAVSFLSDGKVDPHSAKQGALGDCYLLAGCAAEARANPEGIRKLIKDNGDGTFEVTLFIRKNWFTSPEPKKILVDNYFPTRGSEPVYAQVGRTNKKQDEMWMAIFEKALAKETGSYDLISGGHINQSMNFSSVHELLTGRQSKRIATARMRDDKLLSRIAASLENNEPIYAGSYSFNDDAAMKAAGDKMDIIANHAYAIEKVDVEAGTIDLQNPWGIRHPKNISIKDFKKFYQSIDVGQPAKADSVSGPGHQFSDGGGVDAVLDAGSQVGDNVAMTMARGSGTAMASTRARTEASEHLKSTSLSVGQIVYPSEDIRSFYWRFLTTPDLLKFEGLFEGRPAAFFVNSEIGTVVVTDLEGNYQYGVSLIGEALIDLLETGML